MFNFLKFKHNCIDLSLSICDKYLQDAMDKRLIIYENNYWKGKNNGTEPALKNHAKLTTGSTNYPKLSPGNRSFKEEIPERF